MGLPIVSITLLRLYTSPRLAMMMIIIPTLVTNFLQYYRSTDKVDMVFSNKYLLVSLFVCTFSFSYFSFSLEQKTLSFLLGLMIFIFILYRWTGFSLSFGLGFDKIIQVVSGAIIGTAAGFTHVWAPTIAVLSYKESQQRPIRWSYRSLHIRWLTRTFFYSLFLRIIG